MEKKKANLKKFTRRVSLRFVDEVDADFVFNLRSDISRNKYVSQVDSSVKAQRLWIKNYKRREKDKLEYYFVILDDNENKVGLVRVYDFQGDSFCWGSWIINQEAPQYTAIESALSIYEFAFNELGFLNSHFDVRKGNQRVIDFHKRFGAVFKYETEKDLYFTLSKEVYERVKLKYKKFL